MTEGDALRKAVVATPDDDTPRLIYADWLEEHAQSDRAAFIRAQVEAARLEPFSPAARHAETQAQRLLEAHRREWTKHWYGRVVGTPRFRRGFIEHVAIEVVKFESAIETVFELEPIQSLQIVRSMEGDECLSLLPAFVSPRLRQIRRLEFREAEWGFFDDEYAALLMCANLSAVSTLSLRGSAIHRPGWLSELFNSDALPELSELDVADITNLGIGLRNALTKSPKRALRRLDATGVFFESDDLRLILASRCLQSVEELRLGFNNRGGPGPLFELDIGWVIPWQRLRLLDLTDQHLGDDPVRAIVEQEEARALRWLGLSHNELTHDSIKLLTNAKHLNLYHLDLRGNGFSASAIAPLRERYPEALIVR